MINQKLQVLLVFAVLLVGFSFVITLNFIIPEANAVPSIIFTHGVASGDVNQTSAVLWVRIDGQAPLQVEVSSTSDFKNLIFKQNVDASAANDYTAKVLATGLEPNQIYYYHWRHGSDKSDIGTFKTIQSPNVSANIHFTWSGDSDVSKINGVPVFGNWTVLDAVRNENPDFFGYLGDTIYAQHSLGESNLPYAQNLDQYRQLYKDSRAVPALHNLLEAVPVYSAWDDDVYDAWAGGHITNQTLYQIGSKAFYEYNPIMQSGQTDSGCAGPTQYRVEHLSKDAELIVLDTRSCRSVNAAVVCGGDVAPTLPQFVRNQFPTFFPNPVSQACTNMINDPTRTMLGSTQKAMFENTLLDNVKFKFVMTSVPIQQLYVLPYDTWEGYAFERSEILNFIRSNGIHNVVFLTTDQHANIMNNVFIDRFADPTPIAYEFVTGPIAQFTAQQKVSNAFGPPAVGAEQQVLSLLGVNCRNLNDYSYGSIVVNSTTVTATVTLKDVNGSVIHDQLNPTLSCQKTIGP